MHAGYPPPQGLHELRVQIAAHLAATRGLAADASCIVVTAGTQQALRIAAELLLDPGDAAWVEDPGYIAWSRRPDPRPARSPRCRCPERYRGSGCRRRHPACVPGEVHPGSAVTCTTPLGGAPIGRRLALLDAGQRAPMPGSWRTIAIRNSAGKAGRSPPLASLGRSGRVIYCGTCSAKTLAPGLRLGFAVVPAPLVAAFVRLSTLLDRGTDAIGQAVLAVSSCARDYSDHISGGCAPRICAPASCRARRAATPCARSGDHPGARRPAHEGRACRMAWMRRRLAGAGVPDTRLGGGAAARLLRRTAAHEWGRAGLFRHSGAAGGRCGAPAGCRAEGRRPIGRGWSARNDVEGRDGA